MPSRFTPADLWTCPCGARYLTRLDRCPKCGVPSKPRQSAPVARYGRCPHTGRPYRSRTEARWAAEWAGHEYEAIGIRTACGVYWPDFVCPDGSRWGDRALIEVKGAWIRDRALHKVKAAIRPALALGFAGLWLAQWQGGKWTVTELQEG